MVSCFCGFLYCANNCKIQTLGGKSDNMVTDEHIGYKETTTQYFALKRGKCTITAIFVPI